MTMRPVVELVATNSAHICQSRSARQSAHHAPIPPAKAMATVIRKCGRPGVIVAHTAERAMNATIIAFLTFAQMT
jgi:hypothetical protein